MKKQCQALTQRIQQTRQNLAIQSKYRDAAISMTKLYSKNGTESPDGKKGRRSILGHSRTGSDQAADQERIASERKCEDLAAELWILEKRLIDPQSRLLKHTAGILQMTHKGPKKVPITKAPASINQNGIPGSPESMYTYSNARFSIDPMMDEMFFGEGSLYKTADRLDGFGDFGGHESLAPKAMGKEQMQLIVLTEQKLEDLNSRLRAVIVKVNPQRSASMEAPPLSKTGPDGRTKAPGDTLQSHLEYLERGLTLVDQEHGQSQQRQQEVLRTQEESFRNQLESARKELQSSRSQEEAPRSKQESAGAIEETLEEMNHDVRNLLLPFDANRPEPPQLTGVGMDAQLSYFQESLRAIEVELSRTTASVAKNTTNQGTLEQMETVISGLWDIIRSGEEEERQRKQERRQTRKAQNLPQDEDDMSEDDGMTNETFSLQAFSTKVQFLYAQATQLKEHKMVLKRQIKQQRELNNKSDATKDAEIVQRQEELERTQALLTRTEMDADQVREQLSVMMEKLDEARQESSLRDQSRSNDENSAVRSAQAELELRGQRIATLESELGQRSERIIALEAEMLDLQDDHSIGNVEMQSQLNEAQAKIASLTAELAALTAAQATFEISVLEKEKEVEDKEKEMDEMNMEIARLQTEVTIARAELDGAYGSRAQRAANVASNPAIQKEIDDLTLKNMNLLNEISILKDQPKTSPDPEAGERMQMLTKELQETIEEFEEMTKASIEWEKERESLESTIDKLREERERLEGELGDEKVRWLGMKSPGFEGGNPLGVTSTTVLKNEFKKMMRDTRSDHAKALRVSHFFHPKLRRDSTNTPSRLSKQSAADSKTN